MANPLRRIARPFKHLVRGMLKRLPHLRRPGHFTPEDLQLIGKDEDLLFPAVVANVNQNDRGLYNLIHVYRLLRLMAGLAGQSFRDKTLLELGASPEPSLPLILLLDGARRFVANNIFPLERAVPASTARMLSLFLTSLRDVPAQRLGELVTWDKNTSQARLRDEVFTPLAPMGAEDLPLPTESVDAVFSLSVLEHVDKPRAVLAKSFELLKSGGWCYHAIDLRDHSDFNRPVDFLTMTEEAYREATGGSENRVRAKEYVELFRSVGFEIVATRFQDQPLKLTNEGRSDLIDMASWPLEAFYPCSSLDEVTPWVTEEERATFVMPYRAMDLRNLSALGVLVIARKP